MASNKESVEKAQRDAVKNNRKNTYRTMYYPLSELSKLTEHVEAPFTIVASHRTWTVTVNACSGCGAPTGPRRVPRTEKRASGV